MEVVIHDLTRGKISHIANNMSRRQVGDSSLVDLQDIGNLEGQVIGPYRKVNFDGRELKSITAVLRDDRSEPYGLICINFDVDVLQSAKKILAALTALDSPPRQPSALFRSDWQEEVNKAIAGHLRKKGIARSALGREDHAEIISELDQEGYFAIRNVVPYVARLFGTSRATIYKHLREARRQE